MTPTIEKKLKAIQAGKIPAGYRKTAVGIVPKEWEVVQFHDKFSRITRKNAEGNTNVLTISAQYGLINQNDFFNKTIASEDKSNYYLLRKGEFAYNKSYSNGYPFGALKRLDFYDKGIVSPLYICFAANDTNRCPDFYVHYFEAGLMNREIQAFAQEGARNHGLLNISVDDFFKAKLLFPPLPEQKKIAEILTAQDRVIALKEKLVAEKRKQKKFLMQRLLSTDDMRPFKLNGVLIEKGKWEETPFTNVLKKFKNDKPSIQSSEYSNKGDIPIVDQGKNLTVGFTNNETAKIHCPKEGLIVFGDHTRVLKFINFDFAIGADGTQLLEPLKNDDTKFLYHALSNINIPNNGYNRHYKYLKAVKIYHPTLPEQQAIAEVLSAADREISLREQDLEQERQKKKSLMQLLLSGLVRVQAEDSHEL